MSDIKNSKNSSRRLLSKMGALSLLTPIALGVQMACAQASLEEIVITAQKREESLQDTPIAVSAFTATALADKGIDNVSQVADFTPNMTFDTTAPVSGVSSGAVIFIRGIGINDFALTTDPGVGLYIDGVYASRSVGGVMDVLDVERIEVLRGPQGTLFGRNTIGGALSVTSRKPSDQFSAKVSATVGSANRLDVRGSVDIPFSDKFRSNFALSSKQRDGYVDRVLVGDKLGDEDKLSFRGVGVFDATDSLSVELSYDITQIDEASAASVLVGITGNSATAPATSTDIYNFAFGGVLVNPDIGLYDEQFINSGEAGNDQTFATGLNGSKLDVAGTALTINWSGDNIDFKSITALRTTQGTFNRDADARRLRLPKRKILNMTMSN